MPKSEILSSTNIDNNFKICDDGTIINKHALYSDGSRGSLSNDVYKITYTVPGECKMIIDESQTTTFFPVLHLKFYAL